MALGMLGFATPGGLPTENYIYITFMGSNFLILIYMLYSLCKVNKNIKHYTKLIFILGIIILLMSYIFCHDTVYVKWPLNMSFLDYITSASSLHDIWPVFLIYLSTTLNYFSYRKYGNHHQD